jgi:uncharacterized protein (UPF0276 family)
MSDFPHLGHGIGLRPAHYSQVIDERPRVDWFEVISENFMVPGGNPRRVLREVRQHYPVVMHGVSLSLGSTDPLSERYLDELAQLVAEVEPAWVSDHVSWSSFGRHAAHDLWPIPYNEESLTHVAERITHVQDRLKRRILVENPSSYLEFTSSDIPEWQFLAALVERADCGLLLDVNNIFVNAYNHGFDAAEYVAGLPLGCVGQIHLAGHSDHGTHLIDTHDHPVRDEVWDLYRSAVARFGPVSTLIEWDDHIPLLERLLEESRRAYAVEREVLAQAEVLRAV